MRILKKAGFAVAMSLTLAMVSPVVLPTLGTVTVEAATIKLNKTKASIRVGESITLKVTGAPKNASMTWTSGDTSIATVSKNGKVTGKTAGTSTITATVNKKKYDCKITVSKASANREEFSGISFTMPKGWDKMEKKVASMDALLIMPEKLSESEAGNIILMVEKTGVSISDVESIKDTFSDMIKQELKSQTDVKNYKTSIYKSKAGEVLVISYSLKLNGLNIVQKQNYIFLDQYIVQMTATQTDNTDSKAFSKQVKAMIDSIKVIK